MQLLDYIISKTDIRDISIINTLKLLDEDCTIPFIARYRKEKTGNLDEVQIETIVTLQKTFTDLEKRKKAVLKSIDEQGLLEKVLETKIKNAKDLIELEDLYLPFKKKRKTKADTAKEQGLEELAKIIMAQNARDLDDVSQKFLKGTVSSIDQALEGARFIIAEWINERIDIRNSLRNEFTRNATISSKVIKSKIAATLEQSQLDKAQKFRDYFDWSESLFRCPSHRLLALLRAEKEGIVRVKIEVDKEAAISRIGTRIIRSQNDCSEQIQLAIEDAYKRLLAPAISNEILAKYKEKADENAIQVFAKNLKQLLLQAPLGGKNILALDPGFRTGCKLVCLDAQGDLKHNDTVYLHKEKEAYGKISTAVNAYKIDAIAIGNGTASRETEAMVKKIRFDKDMQVYIVNEAGASIYSASKIARDEFPNYDVTVRGSVSIGRRLADPLAELVKIEAKSIGVGQYQHDVDQTKLKQELDTVVQSCVNHVGVNLNTASSSLLSYVSGIGPKLADNIVAYRSENGAFTKRQDLKKVPRLGAKAYEQAVAFLRIKNAKNPLDNSAVHPESYPVVKNIAKTLKLSIEELIGDKERLKTIDLNQFITDAIGIPTLKDIVKELEKPGLDPRKPLKNFEFNPNIKTINDLHVGQILPGIVNNITNFGCFVAIGIKESGLVHISKLSNTYVGNVNDVVHLNQHVKVKVEEVDVARKRIQLSMNF
ncbi:Tex family protein [Flavicella sediminum]|uniref:Tex family protein n=1 Tax=Flavicella sediminum TaxID=2585141 RepID=UPI001123FA14|nr:Tex family protein [Flavicella sediminum]